MAEHIDKTDTLNEGRVKLNEAISDAETARVTSKGADVKSTQALANSESTQTQLDTIVIEGDSSVEAAQARVAKDGETYGTLKARLDAENESVTSQLAHNVQKLKDQISNAEIPLNIPTYYKHDNHAVHPSVMHFTDAKYGYNWIMGFTPYPEGRDRYENPSIAVSDDGLVWRVPEGLENPLTEQPPASVEYYYSDTDLIDNGTQLELWYRYSDDSIPASKILRKTSTDTINWSEEETIFNFGDFGENTYMSPTIVYENETYKVWFRSGDGGVIKYTESKTPNVLSSWSPFVTCKFDYSATKEEHNEWHLEVRKIDGIYMAMICARRISDNDYRLIYLKSNDGINFNDAKVLVTPSYNSWDNDRIYRSSIVKYGGWYYVYYSAFSKNTSNYIGLARGRVAFDLDELIGIKSADYTPQDILGDLGIIGKGKGELQLFNAGVGSTSLQPTKSHVTTLFSESKGKKAFLDLAGLILDPSTNTDIYTTENGVFINPSTHGINVRKNGATQNYARFINFELDANSGDGIVKVRNGGNFIENVVSMSRGFQINFKNMPTVFPFVNIINRGGEGLVTSLKPIGFIYVHEVNKDMAIIGLKQQDSMGHTPLSNITGGKIEVCVIF